MKKLTRLITDKVLAHPAWSGVSAIVAIIALAISVILSSDELNTNSTEVETGQPKWISELRHNPIVPNEGIAGLKIGDPEKKIQQLLGVPTKDSSDVIVDGKYIIDNRKGRILHYATMYEHQKLFLGIYTEPDRKLIKSFRLSDESFNTAGILPSFKGVTIGSTKELLTQQLGEPLATKKHDTCPDELREDKDSSGDAITYYYRGISFWVCTENNLIYLIDIR
jgi:hypothetical protein